MLVGVVDAVVVGVVDVVVVGVVDVVVVGVVDVVVVGVVEVVVVGGAVFVLVLLVVVVRGPVDVLLGCVCVETACVVGGDDGARAGPEPELVAWGVPAAPDPRLACATAALALCPAGLRGSLSAALRLVWERAAGTSCDPNSAPTPPPTTITARTATAQRAEPPRLARPRPGPALPSPRGLVGTSSRPLTRPSEEIDLANWPAVM